MPFKGGKDNAFPIKVTRLVKTQLYASLVECRKDRRIVTYLDRLVQDIRPLRGITTFILPKMSFNMLRTVKCLI